MGEQGRDRHTPLNMSIDESVSTSGGAPPHGFTIDQRRKWPWIALVVAVIVLTATVFFIQRGTGTASPNDTAGATVEVV